MMSPPCPVVVWEYIEDVNRSWYSFDPLVCQDIEASYQRYMKNGFSRSQNDVNLTRHSITINFKSMTTTLGVSYSSPVQRTVFSISSAAAKKVRWEWNANTNGSPFWCRYPADVNEFIEQASNSQVGFLDLSKKFPDLNYTLDLVQRFQTNNHTQYQRSIQRIVLPDSYPQDTKTDSTAASTSSSTSLSSGPSPSIGFSSTTNVDLGQGSGDGSVSKPTPAPRKLQKLPVDPDLSKFAKAVSSPSDDSCSICLVPLSENSGFSQLASGSSSQYASVIKLKQCKHIFHSDCLQAAVKNDRKKSSLTCPTCKTIYGVKEGNQPPGQMTHFVSPYPSLPGHPGCGMITITYNFRSGTQTQGMPNPGQPYHASSFPRIAYLPNNREGQKVLALLRVAWERKLIFTIGRSVTTGRDNVITWNEIHHKTESTTNYSGHGYPDPNYLMNVTEELKLQGVTEDDLK